jgi:hypothetical protein
MRFSHRLLVVTLICAALAWLAGPAGRLLVVLPLLLFGPGYLLERALAAFDGAPLAQRPVIWLGLSLSLIALLYEWTTALGLSLTTPVLYLLTAACGLAVIWRFLREPSENKEQRTKDKAAGPQNREPRTAEPSIEDRRWKIEDRRSSNARMLSSILYPLSSEPPRSPAHPLTRSPWWSLALLAILALTLWTRFTQIESLALPPWVDSVHHALMIRVAAEHGQAPYSLRPYLPVDQLPYHWGYHVFAAAVLQLSGLPLPQSMLWTGQVFNTLQAFAAAALAAHLWRRPLAGVVAALVVGLISIMPAYYLSWGRYTQLAGLLLLQPLMIAWRVGLRTPSRGRFACIAVLLAGLSLVHFRVLIFALAFLAICGSVWAYSTGWATLRARLGPISASAALALALAAPWLWVIAVRTLFPAVARPQNLVAESNYTTVTDGLLWAGHNRWLFALALAAGLWGLARRRSAAAEQAGWVAALVLLANPTLVGLPYIWLITNDVLVISLFLPAGVLIGGGACLLVERLQTIDRRPPTEDRRSRMEDRQPSILDPRSFSPAHPLTRSPAHRLLQVGVAVVLGALAVWGAWDLRSVVNPDTILATSADVAAISWVNEHTPADARFLINAAPWLSIQRGTDGGWWLLPLAGRWTSAPPILFMFGPPEGAYATIALNQTIINFRTGQEQQIYDLIAREHITYIYLGTRPGPLSPATFAGNPAFETVYEHDGVTILAVHP